MKILVCDDQRSGGGKDTRDAIRRTGLNFDVVLLTGNKLRKEMQALVKRGRSFLQGDISVLSNPADDSLTFNDPSIDLAILDNNLADLKTPGTDHTAESLVGYVRAFTGIPYLVSLNKNPHTDFDLRYLVGDYRTQADLALNTKHLVIPSLWTGATTKDAGKFRPWYWPPLSKAPARRRLQEEIVGKCLDAPLLDTVGFGDEQVAYLSRHARGVISPRADCDSDLLKATFLDFFRTSCQSLPVHVEREKTLDMLASPEGSAVSRVRDAIARVVAAEVDRWFRRDVLAPQAVLVDLPHLLARMPFLLGDRASAIECWNDVLTASEAPFGMCRTLYEKHLAPAEFQKNCWVHSQCYWWRKLKADRPLNAKFFEEHEAWAEAVFCEDVSRFQLADSSPVPMEFATEFAGSWNRRYVADVLGKLYTPRSQLAR